jgi:hypothetical protein
MAIDYALQFPCEVRKSIPEAKLITLIKYWGTAEFAIGKFKEIYPHYDMATIINKCTIEMDVAGSDGTARQASVTIAQILSLIAPLEGVKGHCKGCRANVSGQSFGCIGKVNYPITIEAETWLLSRLPNNEKSPSLSLLFKFFSDLEIDGAPVDLHRTRVQMFERKTPVVRNWGGWFNKKQISSSQIIHMLAFGGNIGAQQALLYTKLLGLTLIQSEQRSSSNAVEQFKIFMWAIIMAGKLNVSLLVDA